MNFKKILPLTALGVAMISLTSCGEKKEVIDSETTTEEVTSVDEQKEITVTPVADSKAFPGAKLDIDKIEAIELNADSVTFKVNYKVDNFTLTDMTDDHNAHMMANSHDGQHIHFILDNEPYAALYQPENSAKLKKGTEHYLLSFLSRSYHESIKEQDAYKLKHFKITEDGKYEELPASTEASLFYSRPKGEYKGADAQRILLDFYLVNTELKPDGNKVKVEVNGQSFTLDVWQPYEIKGLPMGENEIKLTLIGADGNPIAGDNVTITRKITLSE